MGYWSTHDYKRRAVSRDVRLGIGDGMSGFVGWKRLIELCSKLQESKSQRDRAIYAIAFLTGGRMGEVLLLQKRNFQVDEDRIVVRNMPLFKRYKKTSESIEWKDEKPENQLARLFKWDKKEEKWWRTKYATERVPEVRAPFEIRRDEPLCRLLYDWLKQAEDNFLFKGYKGGHLSYIRVYQIFSKISLGTERKDNKNVNVHLYPHWLRAQRASCLISFYEMRMEEMMDWMGWEEIETARMYARFGVRQLTSSMREKRYPDDALQLERSLG